jgi:predicted lipoprotein
MIKATGRVLALNEDEVTVLVACSGNPVVVKLNTEYIYGNAIRDASGLVNVKDFVNTMDLNNISGELNKRVRQEVLPAFKASVQKQDSIAFTGAVELNKEHLKLDELSIIPVQIKIIPR